jgi:hypothetical protein
MLVRGLVSSKLRIIAVMAIFSFAAQLRIVVGTFKRNLPIFLNNTRSEAKAFIQFHFVKLPATQFSKRCRQYPLK